ncbi:MAG TPA: POTRA domain-containing protein [Steroidobacteraceae bacterium]|nr:POTRA domain-containing protein [Steroidobacteraceae bacterium]
MDDSFSERLARRWLPAALLGLAPASPVLAATPPPAPGSGTILQQAQTKSAPAPSSGAGTLQIEEPAGATVPASAAFLVSRIEISGNTRIDTATLHALVADAEGRRLTLSQLESVVQRLTDYYRAHGYILARAVVPAQTIHEGVVRVEVVEARYDRITVNNRSPVDTRLLEATLAGLWSGDVVSQDRLDHDLLLLSDIPGATVSATLKPGAVAGSSDLQVDASAAPAVTGSVTADDFGDRYSGADRLGGTLGLFDPLRHGDELTLDALTAGSGMNYGRVSYDTLLDGEGARVGGGYSGLHYRLGGALSDLDAYGTAQDGMLWVRPVALRSRAADVYVQFQYDHLQLNDDIGAGATENRRHLDTMTTSVSGDARDQLLAGGSTTWSASWTCGVVSFDNTAAATADAASADTQGVFSKWNLSLGRLQSLDSFDAVYLGAAGQYSSGGNLDSSEKMVVGGPGSVRAYDVSALSGDAGYQLTAELRHTFARQRYGVWQAVAFADSAHVQVNQRAFAPGPNAANLYGAGLGLSWTGPDRWTAGIMVATPIGARPQLAGDTTDTHLWAQVAKAF